MQLRQGQWLFPLWCLGWVLLGGRAMAAEPGPQAVVLDAQEASALFAEDLQGAVRTGQLQDWLHEPLTLAEGLCIQQRYTLRWPADPKGPSTAREEDSLRLAREHCASAVKSGERLDERLVTQAKMAFRVRLQRLHGLRLAIQSCQKENAAGAAIESCVAQAAARPLSDQELRWLLAATARKDD